MLLCKITGKFFNEHRLLIAVSLNVTVISEKLQTVSACHGDHSYFKFVETIDVKTHISYLESITCTYEIKNNKINVHIWNLRILFQLNQKNKTNQNN